MITRWEPHNTQESNGRKPHSLGLITDWNFTNGFDGEFTNYRKMPNGYELEERVDGGNIQISITSSGDQVKSAKIHFSKNRTFTSSQIDNINRPISVVEENLTNKRRGLQNIISDWTRGDDNVILWDQGITFNAGDGGDNIAAGNKNTVHGGGGDDLISVSYNPSGTWEPTAFGGSGADSFHALTYAKMAGLAI